MKTLFLLAVLWIGAAARILAADAAAVPAATLIKPAPGESPVVAPDGFLRRWLILEPVPSPGLTENIVQAAVKKPVFADAFRNNAPRDGETVNIATGPDTLSLKWHAVETKLYNVNLFHFARSLNRKTSDVIFWVTTTVTAAKDLANVRLAIGSNAASVWWVNDVEVIGIYGDRQTVIDDGVSKRLTLKKGPNVIRAAIVNGGGATDFCARFLDADDKPLRGAITVSVGALSK